MPSSRINVVEADELDVAVAGRSAELRGCFGAPEEEQPCGFRSDLARKPEIILRP